jgi:transposase
VQTIVRALEGNYRAEHLLALSQAVALYDTYQQHVAACEQHIEALLAKLCAPEPPESPLPAPRHKSRQPNALNFDVRAALYAVLGVDLTQIQGIRPSLALKLLSECGTDMSKWPTAKHFSSWLYLAPGNKITGAKRFLPTPVARRTAPPLSCDWPRSMSAKPTAPWPRA